MVLTRAIENFNLNREEGFQEARNICVELRTVGLFYCTAQWITPGLQVTPEERSLSRQVLICVAALHQMPHHIKQSGHVIFRFDCLWLACQSEPTQLFAQMDQRQLLVVLGR